MMMIDKNHQNTGMVAARLQDMIMATSKTTQYGIMLMFLSVIHTFVDFK
jgi:hypothetical protein